MNLIALARPFVRTAKDMMIKNAPTILMSLGTVGAGSAVISGIVITPRAMKKLNEKRAQILAEKKGIDPEEALCLITTGKEEAPKLGLIETVKTCGVLYLPTLGILLLSLGSFWGAHGIDTKRQAILAGLYSTAEAALQEYQAKTIEMIGQKGEKEIKNAIAADKFEKEDPIWIIGSDTEVPCLFLGYHFKSNYLQIKDAENEANREMIQNMYISRAEIIELLDPEGKYMKPTYEDQNVGYNLDDLLVLDIDTTVMPDHKPGFYITVRKKDGTEYPATPGFSKLR